MEQNRVRIADIADALGLSTATVSNVIHGKTKKIFASSDCPIHQCGQRAGGLVQPERQPDLRSVAALQGPRRYPLFGKPRRGSCQHRAELSADIRQAGVCMDSELNLRLLGMLVQSSYLMQTREKYRGQGRLLILLHLYGSLTQRELIELTGRRSATLSEQLDDMEKSGLILRSKNAQDKRNIDVILTEQGQALYNVVDTFFVSHIPDTAQITAMGDKAINALTLAFSVQISTIPQV